MNELTFAALTPAALYRNVKHPPSAAVWAYAYLDTKSQARYHSSMLKIGCTENPIYSKAAMLETKYATNQVCHKFFTKYTHQITTSCKCWAYAKYPLPILHQVLSRACYVKSMYFV